MIKKIAVKLEKKKEVKMANKRLEEYARRYKAIKNTINRYEKDGSEYSLNNIDRLEQRLDKVRKDILYWNNRRAVAKKK